MIEQKVFLSRGFFTKTKFFEKIRKYSATKAQRRNVSFKVDSRDRIQKPGEKSLTSVFLSSCLCVLVAKIVVRYQGFFHLMEKRITYKSAGVNIDSANRFVELIKPLAKSTYNKCVREGIGGCRALFDSSW
jgi:hypothetical protein